MEKWLMEFAPFIILACVVWILIVLGFIFRGRSESALPYRPHAIRGDDQGAAPKPTAQEEAANDWRRTLGA